MHEDQLRDILVDWSVPAADVDAITAELRAIRAAAGGPSYAEIARRIESRRTSRGLPEHERRLARSTVYDAFRPGRKRLDIDLISEIAAALGLGGADLLAWTARCRSVQGAADAASIVSLRTEIPSEVPEFVERTHLVDRLLSVFRDREGATVWIDGMAGAGKTQLALRLARRLLAGRAKAGVFVDLAGHRPNGVPTDPEAVLEAVLRHLGVRQYQKLSRTERIRALHTGLTESKTVLLLDDAADDEQVRSIVGSGGRGMVIVTSRLRQAAMTAHGVSIQGFSQGESLELLRRITPGTVDAEPEAARRLVDALGRLPLALSLAGHRIQDHPTWNLDDHASLIEQRLAQHRVDEHVKAALSVSVGELAAELDRAFRLIADAPMSEVDSDAVAALMQIEHTEAGAVLDELARRNIIVRRPRERFALHSLVRVYGRDRAAEFDPPRLRMAAFERLGHRLVDATWAAYAAVARRAGDEPRPARFHWTEREWEAEAADAWLADTLEDLLAVANSALARNRYDLVIRLSEGLSWWLSLTARYEDAIVLHEAALRAAEELGDATAFATASLDIGQIYATLGRTREALEHLGRAARLEGDLEDPGIVGLLLNMAGVVLVHRGESSAAIDNFERAALVHREAGQSARLISALVNLSVALHNLGRIEQALQVNDEALMIARDIGQRLLVANLSSNHAQLLIELGSLDDALETAERALDLCRDVGFSVGVIEAETSIARVHRRRGALRDAERHLHGALGTARETGDGRIVAEVVLELARVHLDDGNAPQLRARLAEAQTLCAEIEDPLVRAQLCELLGDAAAEESERAAHWRDAAEFYASAGSSRAEEVLARVESIAASPV